MKIIYVIILILMLGIYLYFASGPHCPKHRFTKMNKIKEKEIDSFIIGGRRYEIKHYEVMYKCPKCGEVLIIDEER